LETSLDASPSPSDFFVSWRLLGEQIHAISAWIIITLVFTDIRLFPTPPLNRFDIIYY
jgi:hypothetical protein